MKAHRDPRRLTRASRTTSPYSSLLQSPCNRALRRVEQFPDGLLGALLCELPAVWRCARRVPSTACLLAEFPNPPSLSAPRTHALAVHIPVSRMVVMPDNSKNTPQLAVQRSLDVSPEAAALPRPQPDVRLLHPSPLRSGGPPPPTLRTSSSNQHAAILPSTPSNQAPLQGPADCCLL